jgi:hypothetical protein
MPQQYLDAMMFDDPSYETNFGPVLAAYMPPKCPNTYNGAPQVYDMAAQTCTTLPTNAFWSKNLAASSGDCSAMAPHGGPFLKPIDGQCYSTNDCPVASSYAQACVNAQNIPVRQVPFSSPGAVVNNVYDGNQSDWWRFV